MANRIVYPYGTGGSLPASIGIINDAYTGGADKAWSAEQGKITANDLFLIRSSDVDFTNLYHYTKWYIYTDNKWKHASGGDAIYVLPEIIPGKTYRVYAKTTTADIALLASTSREDGSYPDYCVGYSGKIIVAAGTFYEFTAPEDAHYLYFLLKTSGGVEKDSVMKQVLDNIESAIPKTMQEIALINSKEIDTSSLTKVNGWRIVDGSTWSAIPGSGTLYQSVFIPLTHGSTYYVNGNTTGGYCTVLSSTTRTHGSTPSFSTGYSKTIRVNPGSIYTFTAPEDGNYLYLEVRVNGNDRDLFALASVPISEQLAGISSETDKVRDSFTAPYERYAWLKAQQLVNIRWTPKKQIPKSTSGYFPAGQEQTGMIYSSLTETDKRVGHDVSIHTFMTALNNPYSLIYTENVCYSTSQSAYGIQYYGPANSAAYYGGVCSTYTAYALGMIPYPTGMMDDISDLGMLDVVYDQSANGVKRGDILWQQGHVMYVQDVWRKNGIVTNVQVTEQTQPLAKVNGIYSAEGFNSFLKTNSMTIYRYKDMYKNIDYTPSIYVPVGDEPTVEVTYNNDICTFAGDMPAFLEGDLIYIHCMNLSYPQMELYKDDVLVDTITLASDSRATLTSDNLAYAVNLSNDNLTYGKYKARLKNDDTYSDYTSFEVIRATVTISDNTATYSSPTAKALYWYWCEYHTTDGQKYGMVGELTGAKSGTIDLTGTKKTGYPMFKVIFQGEYGRVAAKFLDS